MKYAFPLICIACFFLLAAEQYGFNRSSPTYTHVTYIFVHANLLHLILNMVAYVAVYNICKRIKIHRESFIFAFVSAIFASFINVTEVLTVGASGMIYAITACIAASVASGYKSLINPKAFFKFLFTVAIGLIASFFFKSINGAIHLNSFIIGFALCFTHYHIKRRIYHHDRHASPS